jgi:hypothetical protein
VAISASRVAATTFGNKRVRVYDVTFDSSYPTGGEPLAASDVGLRKIDWAFCNVKAVGGTVNVANVYFDRANNKLKVYDETPAEAANTSDLSTLVVQVAAFGY